jgi:hypothetical protein
MMSEATRSTVSAQVWQRINQVFCMLHDSVAE